VLEPDALNRLTSLPIWDIAVETEGRAGMNVKTFAATVQRKLLREAIEMDAFEESRHKQVLARMVEFYDIQLQPEPEYKVPRDREFALMGTGYAECIDSFLAFGLFALAKSSGFFPAELVETFEPVMREEGRHILFFVNWVAWRRRNLPCWESGVGRRQEFRDDGLAPPRHRSGFQAGCAICLEENDRRLAPHDRRLIRPRFVPTLARLVLKLLG
jgi:hypothetical protein